MRTPRSLQIYSIFLIFLTTFSAAWPWPKWLPHRDSLIVRRQDSSTAAAKPTNTQPSASPSASATGSNSKTDSGSSTAGSTAAGSTTAAPQSSGDSSAASTTDAPSQTTYDATYPAGGVSLITPAIASGSQYFKVGSNVTFAWNYTSLMATPTAVDIMATCTVNNQLYTIAANQSLQANSTQSVVWDTGAYQATALSDPLLTQMYTLIIYDAAAGPSATAQPGYLAEYNQYTFGMYTPQPYQDLQGWKCVTCSSALGDGERRVIGMAVGVAFITVLSFGWFVNGLGILW